MENVEKETVGNNIHIMPPDLKKNFNRIDVYIDGKLVRFRPENEMQSEIEAASRRGYEKGLSDASLALEKASVLISKEAIKPIAKAMTYSPDAPIKGQVLIIDEGRFLDHIQALKSSKL